MNITSKNTVEEISKYVLEELKKAGADHASCRTGKVRVDEFNVSGKQVELLRTVFTTSISMKAVKDGKKGTISLNKADGEEIALACKACMEAVEAADYDEAEGIAELKDNKAMDHRRGDADLDPLYNRIREFVTNVDEKFPTIVLEDLIAYYTEADVSYLNTNGVNFRDTYNKYGFSTTFSAHKEEKGSSFNYYGANFEKPDKPMMDIGMTATLLAESEQSLETTALTGKFEGTMVLTPASIGFLIETICAEFIGEGALIEGTSIWKDRIDKKVASETFSMVIDPDAEGVVQGGNRITSDGYWIPYLELIRNGVLKNFMLSRYGAKKTGLKQTVGSAGNILILPGEESLEDILKSVENGIYIQRLSGGSPSSNGDFSGVAKNAFLIQNGKLTTPLSETMVSFNVAQVLENIRGISKETANDGSGAQPWIALDCVTVSGK